VGWLDQKDKNGHELRRWCRPDSNSEYAGFCFVCNKTIQCGNSGCAQILKHADGSVHVKNAKPRLDSKQKHFFAQDTKASTSTQGGGDVCKTVNLESKSHRDQVTTAEIMWVMKVAFSGYSFRSCEEVSELFKEMFPGAISKDFSLGRTKVAYILSDGLGPYFREDLAKNINENKVYYTIQFDETGNSQGRKQCDILVRFWNAKVGAVSTQYVKSVMFGHAKGKDLATALMDTISEKNYELPLSQLLSIGSDGPNVNKTVWRLINEQMKDSGLHGLVDLIACPLHTVHNAFRKGLMVYGEEAEELSMDIFQWFKTHPCQKEDFAKTVEDLEMEVNTFLRHVQCRWLTLLPCLQRLKDNWPAICQYFLKDLPQESQKNHTSKHLKENDRYKRICERLKTHETLIQIHFLLSLTPMFQEYLTIFQKQEPLIHMLFPEGADLLKKVMNRFLKFDVVSGKSTSKLCQIDVEKQENIMPLKDVDIGTEASEWLCKVDSSSRQKLLRMQILKFYQEVSKHLAKKLPLDEPVVKNAQCLHPEVRDQDIATKMITRLAAELPNITKDEETRVADEWKVYREEKVEDSLIYDKDKKIRRVDHYWNDILSRKSSTGRLKYPVLKKVVSSCLSLFHGNADVERSLSINKKLLTSERSLLSDEALNGLRITRDAVSLNGGRVADVPITKHMIHMVRGAHSKYQQRLADERSEEEKVKLKEKIEQREAEEASKKNETRKRKIAEKEREIQKGEKQIEEDLAKATMMFEDASKRLTQGLKNKNFTEISLAQEMLEVAKKNLNEGRSSLAKIKDQRNEIETKKKKLIDSK